MCRYVKSVESTYRQWTVTSMTIDEVYVLKLNKILKSDSVDYEVDCLRIPAIIE